MPEILDRNAAGEDTQNLTKTDDKGRVIIQRDTVFEDIKDSIKADDKGRVILGRDFSGKQFRVSVSADGEVLLTPVITIPERDIWLYKNPEALMAFHKGLMEAATGKVTPAEDFSQFANDDVKDA